jgi:hypothetical protein
VRNFILSPDGSLNGKTSLQFPLEAMKSDHIDLKLFFQWWALLNITGTYGIQLWGTASTSNTEILKSFQSKAQVLNWSLDLMTSSLTTLHTLSLQHTPNSYREVCLH